jgi:hypothetical protein
MKAKFTYSVSQLVEAFNFNVSDRTIRRWVKCGKLIEGLHYIRPATKLLFNLDAVESTWSAPRAKRKK